MKSANKFLFVLGLVACGVGIIYSMNSFKAKSDSITIWCNQEPNSADPYDFDLHAHHVVFGSVFSKLFTAYREGVIAPVLVKSWKATNSFREWTFVLRDDVTFADGTRISAEHVALNIKRILILAKKNKSKLKLLDLIDGAQRLRQIGDDLVGVVAKKEILIIRLIEPEENLHEVLAFGLYGIAHPDNFAANGEWKNNILIASGPYEIKTSEKSADLKLRDDYPRDLHHPTAFRRIKIDWDFNQRLNADLADAFLGEPSPGDNFRFKGQTSADVLFLHVFSWLDSNSIFAKLENRIWLREKFYKELNERGIRPVRSFFPPILAGISELPASAWRDGNSPFKGVKITLRPPKNVQVPVLLAVREAIIEAIRGAGANLTIVEDISTTKLVSLTHAKRGSSIDVDIYPRLTSIGNEDPRETAKFMFTKEGIYLPDPDGRSAKLMQDKNFSIQELNRIIFDEAIIWPIINHSLGFWANEKIDLSLYNHQWPLSELHWMGAAH